MEISETTLEHCRARFRRLSEDDKLEEVTTLWGLPDTEMSEDELRYSLRFAVREMHRMRARHGKL